MTIKCAVYKSAQKPDTYLYLKLGMPIEQIPVALQALLGDLTSFLNLNLNANTKLARVSSLEVMKALREQGYFLQMPPGKPFNDQALVSDYMH